MPARRGGIHLGPQWPGEHESSAHHAQQEEEEADPRERQRAERQQEDEPDQELAGRQHGVRELPTVQDTIGVRNRLSFGSLASWSWVSGNSVFGSGYGIRAIAASSHQLDQLLAEVLAREHAEERPRRGLQALRHRLAVLDRPGRDPGAELGERLGPQLRVLPDEPVMPTTSTGPSRSPFFASGNRPSSIVVAKQPGDAT